MVSKNRDKVWGCERRGRGDTRRKNFLPLHISVRCKLGGSCPCKPEILSGKPAPAATAIAAALVPAGLPVPSTSPSSWSTMCTAARAPEPPLPPAPPPLLGLSRLLRLPQLAPRACCMPLGPAPAPVPTLPSPSAESATSGRSVTAPAMTCAMRDMHAENTQACTTKGGGGQWKGRWAVESVARDTAQACPACRAACPACRAACPAARVCPTCRAACPAYRAACPACRAACSSSVPCSSSVQIKHTLPCSCLQDKADMLCT